MTSSDPFASWSEDYKAEQATITAGHVYQLRRSEHEATRHLKEALTYYQSEQWTADGVESEALDTLINTLRQNAETAACLRQQAETTLGRLLHSQRPYEDANALTQRHNDMVRAARPIDNQPGTVEPTPLETFLTSRKIDNPKPVITKAKSKKRSFTL
jgi:hypothetical protein